VPSQFQAARRFRRFTGDAALLVPGLRDPMINVVSLDTARSNSSNISIVGTARPCS
jgi:hypothetical protein